jgi:chromosome segregation ATPase
VQGRQGEKAALVDATRYDFERLERALAQLVEQQAQLLVENDTLREQVEDRELRIHRLESELDESNSRRHKAMERLDALITELDRLDEGLERSLRVRGGTPAVGD